jgi:hypothetical protein
MFCGGSSKLGGTASGVLMLIAIIAVIIQGGVSFGNVPGVPEPPGVID